MKSRDIKTFLNFQFTDQRISIVLIVLGRFQRHPLLKCDFLLFPFLLFLSYCLYVFITQPYVFVHCLCLQAYLVSLTLIIIVHDICATKSSYFSPDAILWYFSIWTWFYLHCFLIFSKFPCFPSFMSKFNILFNRYSQIEEEITYMHLTAPIQVICPAPL